MWVIAIYYWNPLSLEWTKEKPTVTVPANKIKEKNNLGNFANILEVYSRYPDGGKEGDYLFIDGIEYVWNRWERIWQSKGDTTPTGGRTTNTFDGDLAVENDLIVGGILRVKGSVSIIPIHQVAAVDKAHQPLCR